MKIYLAARYSRNAEMAMKAAALEGLGHEVTARWIRGNHQIADEQLNDGETEATLGARYAQEDLQDIDAAEIAVFFTEQPRTTSSRGGRHVEFGAALMMGKRCIIVGPRENVFHCLPGIEVCATWDELKALLGND